MDNKKPTRNAESDDLKGFEEFIDGQSSDSNFLPRGVTGNSTKKETGFEHFTFLMNDSARLSKLKSLLTEKLSFVSRFDQSSKLIQEQNEELELMRQKIFEINDQPGSAYRKSLKEIFDSFFEPPKA